MLAPNATLRPLVVPKGPPAQSQAANAAATAAECEVETGQARPRRTSWARLLKRVFDIDMQHCPNCGAGELKIIAAILERPVVEKILTHLGLSVGHKAVPADGLVPHEGPELCEGAACKAGSAATAPRTGARGGARLHRLSRAGPAIRGRPDHDKTTSQPSVPSRPGRYRPATHASVGLARDRLNFLCAHLRFFSRHGAVQLLEQAGLRLTGEATTGNRRGDRDFWKDRLTLGLLQPFFVMQHLLKGTRAAAG